MITATIAPVEHRYELVPDGITGVIVDRMLGESLAGPRPVADALAALRVLEHAAVAERAASALAQLTASAMALSEAAAAAHEDLRARWRDGTALLIVVSDDRRRVMTPTAESCRLLRPRHGLRLPTVDA
jgi:hypothetical protein